MRPFKHATIFLAFIILVGMTGCQQENFSQPKAVEYSAEEKAAMKQAEANKPQRVRRSEAGAKDTEGR